MKFYWSKRTYGCCYVLFCFEIWKDKFICIHLCLFIYDKKVFICIWVNRGLGLIRDAETLPVEADMDEDLSVSSELSILQFKWWRRSSVETWRHLRLIVDSGLWVCILPKYKHTITASHRPRCLQSHHYWPPDRQHQVLQVLPSIRWKDCRRRQTEKEHQSSQLLWRCSKTLQLLFNFFYRHCLIKVLLHIFSVLESWGWNHHYWKMGKCIKSHFAGFHICNYSLTV